jgi:hypothetical protein
VTLLYKSGQSLRQIAQVLQTSKTKVRKTLLDKNIILRPATGKSQPSEVATTYYGLARINGEIIEDAKEQKVIRLILTLWHQGQTSTAIAESLNSRKVKPRLAQSWSNVTIRKIILRQTQSNTLKRKK